MLYRVVAKVTVTTSVIGSGPFSATLHEVPGIMGTGGGAGAGVGCGPGFGAEGAAGELEAAGAPPVAEGSTSLTGMANPMLSTGLPELSVSSFDTTTPTTSPSAFRSGPPLLPGFMAASVCSRPGRLAEMIPTVTVGVLPRMLPSG